jgi:hypothetical protein
MISVRGIQRVNSFATRVRFELPEVTMDFAGTPEEKLKFDWNKDDAKNFLPSARPTVCPPAPVPKTVIGKK